jgi:hypothetical protein
VSELSKQEVFNKAYDIFSNADDFDENVQVLKNTI